MKKTNRLIQETSPYLLQHAHNPVEWYPWGEEALNLSKKEGKPIFLSIGYSACHWCHVMEKESFENEETAKILNQYFISIKVDREERPDIDNLYMSAVQMMTQHGGWPLSVFLTPDLEPFYGGTYFPPEDKMGMPSFNKILIGVANAWKGRREEVSKSAKELVSALKQMNEQIKEPQSQLEYALIEKAVQEIQKSFDPEYGGIGSAPKFFHTIDFRLLLRFYNRNKNADALNPVTHTLNAWRMGGIYDHLGGGFHRYSTDRFWFAPHFEKMLYDNALVIQLYLEAFQITRDPHYSKIIFQTLDYCLNRMQNPDGGFYSTEDADSEGEEGKYYTWSKKEIETLLNPDIARLFNQSYQVIEKGNWEQTNILYLLEDERDPETLSLAKRKLLAEREKRIPPLKDTKIIVAWNGYLIETLAMAGRILKNPLYLDAAKKASSFILKNIWDGKKRELYHSIKDGKKKHLGCLDDYASFVNALITLYETTLEKYWLDTAEEIGKALVDHFWDTKEEEFFYASRNQSDLLFRPKENHDGATPSATGLTTFSFLRIGKILRSDFFLKKAETTLKKFQKNMEQIPMGSAQMLLALDFYLSPDKEIVVASGETKEEFEETLEVLYEKFIPNRIFSTEKEKKSLEGKTTVYICENFTCKKPISNILELKKEIECLF